jgi:hypothetical protein
MSRAQVDCIACHKALKHSSESAAVVGQTFVGVQESCNYCHGTKYDGALDTWKSIIKTNLEDAEAAYAEAKARVDKASLGGVDQLKVNRLLDDANHNITLVKLGHGVHNVNYSTALLNVATQNCAEVKKVLNTQASTAK